MKLRERFIESIGLITKRKGRERYFEGYAEGYNDRGEDEPVSGTLKQYGYRSVRGSSGNGESLRYLLRIL